MAENEDKDSKTEQPTEKKVKDATDKGQVPNSRELPIVISLLVVCSYVGFFLIDTVQNFGRLLASMFEISAELSLENGVEAQHLLHQITLSSAIIIAPFFASLMIFGFLASGAQTEPRLVLDRIAPKFERLSIAKGLSRIFGKQGLVEFAKSFGKIVLAGVIVGVGLWSVFHSIMSGLVRETASYFVQVNGILAQLLGFVCFAMALIAIFDVFWSRYSWLENLKMSAHEVKEEMKQAEGDPIVKARLRSIARDRSRHRMFEAIPFATLVVTNPTHLAVALKFDVTADEAPIVVAKGQDIIAQRIKEIASSNDVPMFENVPLARALNKDAEIGQAIPEEFYKAIAELINFIHSRTNTR